MSNILNLPIPVPFTDGGFGFNTATTGDLFYASGTNTPGKLADVATGSVLTSGGVGVAPAYSASPTLTGLNLSGLTASSLIATDGSNNLTSTVSGLTPDFTALKLGTTFSVVTANTKLNIFGPDSSSTSAPGIGFFTNSEFYPQLTIMSIASGNTAVSFDSYYTGNWISSNNAANFQITNTSGNLNFNIASGVAQGGIITWTTALYIDSSAHINLATPGVSASNLLALDSSKNITTSVSGLSPTFTGLTLSGLTSGSLLFAGTSGVISQSNSNLFYDSTNHNVYIGTGGIGSLSTEARLVCYGTDNSISNSQSFYTTADNYPQLQILPFGHDNIAISFDGYYNSGWKSSYSSSNFQFQKIGGKLTFNYASGTQGSAISWTTALSIDTSGNVNLPQLSATGILTTDSSKNITSVAAASTYTPTIGDGTNNFITTTAQGKYYKIGPLYFVSLNFIWTSKGSVTGTNSIAVSLPTTCAATDLVSVNIGYGNGLGYSSGTLMGANAGGSNTVNFYSVSTAGSASAPLTCNQATATGDIILNLFLWSV